MARYLFSLFILLKPNQESRFFLMHLLSIYETRMAMPPLKGIYKIRNVRTRHHAALKNQAGDLVACEDCGDGDAEIVSSAREWLPARWLTTMLLIQWEITSQLNSFIIKHTSLNVWASCDRQPKAVSYVRSSERQYTWSITESMDGKFVWELLLLHMLLIHVEFEFTGFVQRICWDAGLLLKTSPEQL